jgi:hypothetical protein
MNKSILIGLPSGSGVVPLPMVQSLLMLHKPLSCGFMSVERQRIDKARNALAMGTLKGNFDYLFMVDDDNPIPPDTLEKFLEDDKDIIIAPIPGRVPNKEGQHPLCAFYSENVEIDGDVIRLYKNIIKFRDEGPLHKIDGGGTGCMLVKRTVLEAMFKKYQENMFEFGDIRFKKTKIGDIEYDRRTMSEDAEFCERAIDLGFEVWLDDRVKPFHLIGERAIQYG